MATQPAEQPLAGVAKPRETSFSESLKRQLGKLPLHIILIFLAVLWSVPTIALLISSFREPVEISSSGWWNAITSPGDFTLTNYDEVLNARGMGDAFINSLLITIPATMLVILVASFAAYAFAWMEFPGRNTLFLLVVAMLVVPLQMTLIPVLRLYANIPEWDFPLFGHVFAFTDDDMPLLGGRVFGVGSYLGIWMAHAAYGLPFAVFLLRNFFGGLPRDLFESAYLDGASELQVFRKIVMPLSMPAIAALAIFQFLWTWNDLLVALVLLQDPDLQPMTLRINSLVSSFGTNYEVLTAAAFVSMAVPLFLFFALQRYFVQGILAGSVKG